MSAQWHVGMKLVCVSAQGAKNLTKGDVYTISGFDPKAGESRTHGFTEWGVFLAEAAANHEGWGFHPTRFRPVKIRKTDISIFTALLNPSPADRADIELADFIIEHALPLEQVR